MNRRAQTPHPGRFKLRHLAFALIPAAALLIVASLSTSLLERLNIIDTEVPDDRALYGSGPAFRPDRDMDDPEALYVSVGDNVVKASFPVHKPEGTFRIFVLGGSFAMGTPYVHQANPALDRGGMSCWIREDLRARYPSLDFEVINAAAGGQTSHRVVEILKEVLDYDPDLVFAATGNNDGSGRPGTFNRIFHRWTFYRLLRAIVAPQPGEDISQRPLYAPQYQQVDEVRYFFQRNVSEMVRTAGETGVPLALATMPVNLKYNPPGDARYDIDKTPSIYRSCLGDVRRALCSGDPLGAAAVLFICPESEDFFILGTRLEREGRFDAAAKAYLYSIELEPKNRMRPSLNMIVRSSAQSDGVILIDLEAAAQGLAADGIPGYELFRDYCHMHWHGYAAMGREAVNSFAGSGLIPAKPGEPLPYAGLEELRARTGVTDDYLKNVGKPLAYYEAFKIEHTSRPGREDDVR